MKRMLITTLMVATVGLWACQKAATTETAQPNPSEATTRVAEKEKPGVSNPTDLSPAEAEARIDDVAMGHALGADGAIMADMTGDDFVPGKPIYLAMEVGDTPADSAVKVVWFGPNETRVGEQTKRVAAGTKFLNFSAGNTSTWGLGDYRAEVWIGDEKVAAEMFNLVKAGQSDKG